MTKKKGINFDQFFSSPPADDDLVFLMGGTEEETADRALARGLPLLHLPPEVIAPDPDQLRHLPPPDALTRLAADGDQAASALLAGLRELGQSMQEHGQLQPIVVYADHDEQNPAITHRLLNGQRRWSAAILSGLPTLWAVETARPTRVTRLMHQFEENERREGFTDMERTWALIQLKDALQTEAGGEVPWRVVEELLQLSSDRRHDLQRLLRFAPEGQALLVRHGWSEWTLRPLHMAINAGSITQDDATRLLHQLTTMDDVSATVVARLVRASTAPADTSAPAPETSPQGRTVARRMERFRRAIDDLRAQLAGVTDATVRQALHDEAVELQKSLEDLLHELQADR
jgi:ParB-like chromosome segregation protein Spo0J